MFRTSTGTERYDFKLSVNVKDGVFNESHKAGTADIPMYYKSILFS